MDLGLLFPDWALLSAELQFIYLDPIFASHLDTQADLLIGKSLLSFVHPDEQSSAKSDLSSVLHTRTLHGSVTRSVRFSLSSPSLPPDSSWFLPVCASCVSPKCAEILATLAPLPHGQMHKKSLSMITTWPWTSSSTGLPRVSFSASSMPLSISIHRSTMTSLTNLSGQIGVAHPSCPRSRSNSSSAVSSCVSPIHLPHLVLLLVFFRSSQTIPSVSFSPGLRIKETASPAGSWPDSWRMRRWIQVHTKITMPKRAAHAGTGPPNSCPPHLARSKASLYRMVTFFLSLSFSKYSHISRTNPRHCHIRLPQARLVPPQHLDSQSPHNAQYNLL